MVRIPVLRRAVICLSLFVVLAGAAQAPAGVSSHEEAARELFRLSGGEDLALESAEAMLGVLGPNPEMAPYRQVFREWTQKVFNGADFEAEIVRLYVQTFSEKEIREITAFYKTPVGRKAISAMPELMRQGTEIGMKRAEEHAGELQEMLTKAQEERENEPPANDEEAQKRTVAHIRNTGTAMFSWLTDQVGAGAAGQSQTDAANTNFDFKHYPLVSRDELVKLLVPDYMQKIPKTDGWGHPYEYYLNVANPLAPQVMGIRSPGRDGKFSANNYTVGAFDPDDLDEDIVWADGFFVRWPQVKED